MASSVRIFYHCFYEIRGTRQDTHPLFETVYKLGDDAPVYRIPKASCMSGSLSSRIGRSSISLGTLAREFLRLKAKEYKVALDHPDHLLLLSLKTLYIYQLPHLSPVPPLPHLLPGKVSSDTVTGAPTACAKCNPTTPLGIRSPG